MSTTFKVTGTKRMKDKIRKIMDSTPNKLEAALRVEAELIMTSSKRDFVPVDLGTLRSSGFVNDVTRSGPDNRDLSITLGYGGAAEAYAIAVHEHPSASSPSTWEGKEIKFNPEGRGPKYLEKPLMQAIDGMTQRIADRVKLEQP